jgi:2-C-methyl-D-erythritol 4-phosphate cytidylyltransferase
MTIHALLAAAGRGERLRDAQRPGAALDGHLPKQLLRVGGRPLLAWAVARLRAAGVERFVVAAPPELLDRVAAALDGEAGVQVVAGGASRQESVQRALAATAAAPEDWVLVHDAARAAVHPEDVQATVAAAEAGAQGAVLGRPLTDTLKRVEEGHVLSTVERASLFRAETPQLFRRTLLERAYARADADHFAGTDECSLVERLAGVRIAAVNARHPNPKLTYPDDLRWLELLLAAPEAAR